MSTGSGAPYVTEPQRPGWPARLGPLVVPAGVVRLRPVRLRDGPEWSRLRLRDREYLERWEPEQPGSWRDRNGLAAWPMCFCIAVCNYSWYTHRHIRAV